MAPDLRPLLQTWARSEPDLDSNGDPTWDPNGIQSGSHPGPKWDPIRVPFGTRNGIRSGSHLGSHTGPNWAPFGEPLRGQPGGLNPPQGTDQCLLHSSRIVGGVFRSEMSGVRIVGIYNVFEPRIVQDRSEVPRWARQDPEAVPIWIPSGSQKGSNSGPIWDPKWDPIRSPFGAQNGLQMGSERS